ncbi:MAG: ChuX/HutX family heme-like substrate-binding protein [Pseudomonadota bacterium]
MTETTLPAPTFESYEALKADNPTLRARDIADKMGVSEGALAELRTASRQVRRLALRSSDFLLLMTDLRDVGPVMTLTRNEAAVHETHGQIEQVSGRDTMGQIVGPIDLRMFFRHWQVGYEVAEETRSGLRRSFQIFDTTGKSVLKIYGVAGTRWDRWAKIVDHYADASTMITSFAPPLQQSNDAPDEEIDRAVLRREWLALEHSHNFPGMLRELGIGREQAMRLAGEDLAQSLAPQVLEHILSTAAERQVPIMCFVGNIGCLQIYTGPIQSIKPMGPWLNVLDPTFNLHLRTDRIASLWRVIKPTQTRGTITSIEAFDADGELILQLFGQRPPGEGERDAWRGMVRAALEGAV